MPRSIMLPMSSRLSLAALVLLSAPWVAQAEPTTWSTGQIRIEFDPDTFAFTSDTVYIGPTDISPAAVSYSQAGQGVLVNFNGLLSAYASSYQQFSPEWRSALVNAFFGFTAEAGYAITGYTVTYNGSYFVEQPGSVGLVAQQGAISLNNDGGGETFSLSTSYAGGAAPQIQAELSAYGGVDYIEVLDHYEQIFSHYEQVLDYCDPVDPTICFYRDEPVYITQPVYRTESDLGEGQIHLATITVQAQVTAVPEPGAVAMAAGGLGLVGWRARRRGDKSGQRSRQAWAWA